jgi:hypothetical protein
VRENYSRRDNFSKWDNKCGKDNSVVSSGWDNKCGKDNSVVSSGWDNKCGKDSSVVSSALMVEVGLMKVDGEYWAQNKQNCSSWSTKMHSCVIWLILQGEFLHLPFIKTKLTIGGIISNGGTVTVGWIITIKLQSIALGVLLFHC